MGLVGHLFREQGVYITASNYAAILNYGHDDAEIPKLFDQDGLTQAANPSCHQIDIDLRASKDAEMNNSNEVGGLSSNSFCIHHSECHP